jgi:DNA-binding MarR family transcriptional regulator
MRSGTRDLRWGEAGLLRSLEDGLRGIAELAGTEALGQPSVGMLVDSLEGRGLVTRGRASDDGRVVLVSISGFGRARLEAVRDEIRSLLRGTLLNLEDDELTALVKAEDVLQRVTELLGGGVARQ